jgi:branched-subunit amino acid ABC-type transport system permease component
MTVAAIAESDVRTFLQALVVGVSTGSAFALVGISFVLIYRTTNIINFAQGAFAVMGGLFTFWLVPEVPVWLAGAIAVFLAASAASSRWASADGRRRLRVSSSRLASHSSSPRSSC